MHPFSTYQVGVNLGGWISQYGKFDPEHFRSFITEADIHQIASWGMDHVRLPVDYPVLEDDDRPFTYKDDGFACLDRCLEWCDQHHLGLVLDLHKAPGFAFYTLASNSLFSDAHMQERFLALWTALAERYRSIGNNLVFELLNEIVLPDSAPWNALARRAVQAIRRVDPQRMIMIGGNHYNTASELANLDLYADPNVVYTFHCYAPMLFTHQKAHWVAAQRDFSQPVEYPGVCPWLENYLSDHPQHRPTLEGMVGVELNRDLLVNALQPALDFMQRTGKQLYCGEFGAIEHAPAASRRNWHRDFIGFLNEAGIGRACWSYKRMDFGLVDYDSSVMDAELVKIVSQRPAGA